MDKIKKYIYKKLKVANELFGIIKFMGKDVVMS